MKEKKQQKVGPVIMLATEVCVGDLIETSTGMREVYKRELASDGTKFIEFTVQCSASPPNYSTTFNMRPDVKVAVEPRELRVKPGVYRLTKDVKNPEPDRRSKDWVYVPLWKQGSKIVFDERNFREEAPTGYANNVRAVGAYSSSGLSCYASREAFDALARASEPVERSLLTVLEMNDLNNRMSDVTFIIRRLLEMGKLSLDDIDAALAFDKQKNEEEWQAEQAAEEAAKASKKAAE